MCGRRMFTSITLRFHVRATVVPEFCIARAFGWQSYGGWEEITFL